VHQPIDPSAFEISSIARNTVSGGSSGPPIERGKNIWKSPAAASASTTRGGTRRNRSPSSRASTISGANPFAAATTSAGGLASASGQGFIPHLTSVDRTAPIGERHPRVGSTVEV
jgi:hypothetical protein